jgi:hypothetical protein
MCVEEVMAHRVKTVLAVSALACLPLFLAACDGGTIYKKGTLGDVQTLSIDARQRLVISGKRKSDGVRVVCAEPSPDALVAQAAVLAAQGNFTGKTGAPSAAGSAVVGFQESAASIGLRTQSIQVLRDGYYRLCETYLNDAIDKKEYLAVIQNVDTFIAVSLAIDGMSNPKAAQNVAISTGPVTAGSGEGEADDKVSAKIGDPDAAVVKDPAPSGKTDSNIAVAQIIRDYLNYNKDSDCPPQYECNRLRNTDLLVTK